MSFETAKPAFRPPLRQELEALLDAQERPLVPSDAACFPPERVDHGALHARLLDVLREARKHNERDPYTNPIQIVALEIQRMLDSGAVSPSAVEQVVQRLAADAFVTRAERTAAYVGETAPDKNRAALAALVRRLATDGKAGHVPFEVFRARVEAELFGVVATAHPTFGLTADLYRAAAQLATDSDGEGRPLTQDDREELLHHVVDSEHRPDRVLDLMNEHALSLQVLANAQAALRRLYEVVFEVAEEAYPADWQTLKPRLITLATWVGYDIDGRSDIKWTDTFNTRLKVQALQLEYYLKSVQALHSRCVANTRRCEMGDALDVLEARLQLAIREIRDEIDVFQSANAKESADRERIRLMAKRMHDGRDRRLIHSEPIIALIERAMALSPDHETLRALCVLRAEIANHGLGMAHTHVRLNAMQLHNSIRKIIGMEAPPADPGHRRSYLAAVDALLAGVEAQTISFGSVLGEKASARRLTMIVAQMIKYVDGTTPVRFLIAECEAGATLLTALYFARLFGIERQIDISPLFETPDALDHGAVLLDEALRNAHFRDYLRQRGRLCIQTGFSDSGRYLGQTAAGYAIEQLRLRVGSLLARYELHDVQLVVFNTHGESIGRGAHPGSFRDRLRYVATPASRARFKSIQIDFKEEVSFQGGDGWLYFITEPMAFATMSRIVEYALSEADEDDDPFYAESDYVAEFFTAVRLFNDQVMDDPNYAALLGAYGVNMLYPTGSRAVRRQTAGGRADLSHPSQMRAIPQNGILQQLGFLANTIGGLGHAIHKDPEAFQRLYHSSPRFRRLVSMAEYALRFSDFNVLRGYVDTLDPGLWLLGAATADNRAHADDLRKVSDHLERIGVHDRLARILRVLQKDYLDLIEQLAFCGVDPGDTGSRVKIDEDSRDNLHLLHALKIALIQKIFLLAVRIPEFSNQSGTSPEQLVGQIMQLDVESAVEALERVFPQTDPAAFSDDFGEPATYRNDVMQSYEQEHRRIFRPLANLYDLVRRTGTAIIHHVGSIG